MSLPNSTVEIRWPLPGEGYRTMAFSIVAKKEKNELVPLAFPTNIKVDPVVKFTKILT